MRLEIFASRGGSDDLCTVETKIPSILNGHCSSFHISVCKKMDAAPGGHSINQKCDWQLLIMDCCEHDNHQAYLDKCLVRTHAFANFNAFAIF